MYKNRKENYPLYEIRDLHDLRQLVDEGASMFGDKAAFRFRDGKEIRDISYREFKTQVDSFGTALSVLGIADKHIAIIGGNCYAWALSYLTVLNSPGVVVPVDKDLNPSETEYIFNFSDAAAVIYSKSVEEKIDAMVEHLPKVTHYICMGEPATQDDTHYSLDQLLAQGRKALESGDTRYTSVVPEIDGLKELLFTSGTTGKSKGVMLSERSLCHNIVNAQKLMWISDTCLSVLPYHHCYESTTGILTMLHKGMTICINESLRTVLPNFKVYKPTEVQLVPLFVEKIYRGIWDKIEEQGKTAAVKKLIRFSNGMLKTGIDLRKPLFKSITDTFGGRLKAIICGGAPLKPFLTEFFDAIGITLINGYGITECGPLVSINRPEFHDYESVGQPLPGLEIMIDNPNENGEGEICVKGPNVMLGYYKNEEATRQALIDGWFHTGDIGKIGHDNFLFITGRMKNVIILQNGKNVYPEEIEDRLCVKCEYIAEVLVSAVRKEGSDSMVLGCEIYPDYARAKQRGLNNVEDVIRDAVAEYNKEEPSYKTIKSVCFRDTEFDKTTSKKIKRVYGKKG